LSSDTAQHCLQPVCDIDLDDAFTDNEHVDDDHDDREDTLVPTIAMTLSPPTLSPTMPPTVEITPQLPLPSFSPTPYPTMEPTPSPTTEPTPSPTILTAAPIIMTAAPTIQTAGPTVQEFGSVEVSVEVGVTLEGIDMSDLDITALDDLIELLENVFGDMLPKEAIVRLLKVGTFSVPRRLLRFLEDGGTGVEVEFEIIMSKSCSSAKCDDSEADEISATLYNDIASDIEAKVVSGELMTSIQEEAEAKGVSELSDVTINASTMWVGEAKVTVKDGKKDESPTDPTDDDDNASSRHAQSVKISIMAGFLSVIFLLHI